MQLTLLDVMSRATTLAGGRRDWDTSEVSFWANLAAVEIFNQVHHTPLESLAYSSTTSGENRISLPADFDAPISLSNLSASGTGGNWISAGANIPIANASWTDSLSTAVGAPGYYALFSDWMELWPSPDSSYSLQLRYHAKQPVMADSSSTPRFDERWHTGWLYKTAALLQASRDNPEGEALANNRYVNYMTSIQDDKAKRQMAQGISLRYVPSGENP